MKTIKLKSILFGLIAFFTVTTVMTSCEQDPLKDLTEQLNTNFEEGHTCSGCMLYSSEEPDEIVDVLIKYGEDSEPVYEKAARYGEVVVYGGDVVLTQNYSSEIALRGNIISDFSKLWTNSTMPYVWGPGLTDTKKAQILNAINDINLQTNLCVIERTNEADYVEFRNDGGGCFVSDIGNSGTPNQTIHIGDFCFEPQIIHEILHKAGFYHEQTRPDRDNFITVNWDNLDGASWTYQFLAQGGETASGNYDFASIMHYPQYHNSVTIDDTQPLFFINDGVSLPSGMNASDIGNLSDMSATDIAAVNSLYPACGGGSGDCDNDDVFGSFSWLSNYVDENNCTNEEITVYESGGHNYIHIQSGNSGKLYYNNILYCTDSDTYDCVSAYGFTNVVAEWACDCGEPEPECDNDDVFGSFSWLSNYVDENNCTNRKITVYESGGHNYIHIQSGNSGKLYYNNILYCTDSDTYDCVSAYGFTNVVAEWACCN